MAFPGSPSPRRGGAAWAIAAALAIAFAGAAAPLASPPDEDVFRFKLDRLRPGDHAGLLGLGTWCEQKGHADWARTCFRKVVQLGDTPSYPDASFRLARIEISQGKSAPAFKRLRELVARFGHAEARALLAEAEDATGRKQRELLAEASKNFDAHLYAKAKELYAAAFSLLPEERALGPLLAEEEILPQAVRCQEALDAAFREREGLGSAAGARTACAACATATVPGFPPCAACSDYARPSCATCRGLGFTPCAKCSGLTFVVAESGTAPALAKIAGKIVEPRMRRLELREAAREIELSLLEAPGAFLLHLAALTARPQETARLWDRIPSVPFPARGFDAAVNAWRDMGKDHASKAAFLLSFACEYARFLARYDLFREVSRPLLARPEIEKLLAAPPESLLRALAFPEKRAGRFLSFEGTIGKVEAQKELVAAALADAGAGGVRLVAWTKEARQAFEHLAIGPWKDRIGRLRELIPAPAAEELRKAPEGWRFRFAGRLLRNPARSPPTWIEVWAAVPLYPGSLARLVEGLREPVTIALRNIELRELLSVSQTLLGLTIELKDVPPTRRLNLVADGCTVGRMVREVARALGLAVYAAGDRIVLAPQGPEAAVRELALAIDAVSQGEAGFLVAGTIEAPAAKGPAPPPEEYADPVAAYRKAAAAMAYREAADHLATAILVEKDAAEKRTLERTLAFAELGALLTGAVRSSDFARAEKLARIRIRSARGGEDSQVVRILERKSGGIMVEASYGARFTVPADQLIAEEEITGKAWQEALGRRLAERVAEAHALAGTSRASELFSAALLAKRIGMPARGHEILRELLGHEEVPWLAASFFPEERERALKLWKESGYAAAAAKAAKGRGSPPGEVAAAPKVEPPAGAATGGGAATGAASGAAAGAGGPAGAGADLPREPEKLRELGLAELGLGVEARRRSLSGAAEAQKEIKAALMHFQRAREAFARYLEGKDDPQIREKLGEAIVLLQGCVKDLPFFD